MEAVLNRRFSLGDFLLLLVALTWGGSYLAIKELTKVSDPAALLTLRFIPAAAFLWLFWLKDRTRFSRNELWIGAAFGVSQVIILNLEAWSVKFTSATNGGLIVSLAILMTPVFEGWFTRRWQPPRFFIAALLSVVGVALLILGNGFVTPNLGDLLMLGAAVLRATHFGAAGVLTQGKPYSPLNLTVLQVSTAALIMTISAPGPALAAAAVYQPEHWLLIVFISLFCTSLAFIAMTWAIKHTSATRTSLLLGTEPIFATLIAAILGGEAIGPLGIFGAVVIISATYWGQAIELKHRSGMQPEPALAQ